MAVLRAGPFGLMGDPQATPVPSKSDTNFSLLTPTLKAVRGLVAIIETLHGGRKRVRGVHLACR